MIASMDINITKAGRSKLQDINLDNMPFGHFFSDHMLEADYEGGEWKNIEIKPYMCGFADNNRFANANRFRYYFMSVQ